MNNTHSQLYKDLLAKALNRGKKQTAARKLTKANYSSFWMDDLGKGNARFGLSEDYNGKNNDLTRSIKLNSYRKAIANFVKILTSKEIPVRFHGSQSYTDGDSVTISTDIKDTNFDVAVGLALHEASHILMTDFDLLPALRDGKIEAAKHLDIALVKDILNYVEDRRIDYYVFSTSPGYKAYYHKLYEHYWNSPVITKGLCSTEYRNASDVDSWMFQIINMTNPAFDATVMPRLQEIVDLINIPNIKRLKSTQEALDIAIQVTQIITDELNAAQASQKPQEPQDGPGEQAEGEQGQGGQGEGEGDDNEGEGVEGEGSEGGESLTSTEARDLRQQLNKQKDFLNGKTGKKTVSYAMARKLDRVDKQGVELSQVNGKNCFNYDVTGKDYVAAAALKAEIGELKQQSRECAWGSEERKAIEDKIRTIEKHDLVDKLDDHYFTNYNVKDYVNSVAQGLLMGQLLGKKLQMRNESRERIDNRLTSGKIDNRRLAAAGYGIESVFHQVTVDKYKKANLHLSLDGSGSMSGKCWSNTLLMTTAIAKALTYTQNVHMQISIRVTVNNNDPANYLVYDSRKNTIRELQVILNSFSPNGMTPEGLCFESMIKKNQLVPATADVDSYFVNISDGGPGGCGNYYGDTATTHTRAQVTKMRTTLGMGVLSYFMSEYDSDNFANTAQGRMFTEMYGNSASHIKSDNVMDIARTLNKLFMTK